MSLEFTFRTPGKCGEQEDAAELPMGCAHNAKSVAATG